MGTITGISDLDPVRWSNSHWRSVKVFQLYFYNSSTKTLAPFTITLSFSLLNVVPYAKIFLPQVGMTIFSTVRLI